MPQWIKNLSPTREPVLYAVAALVLYQLFVQHQPLDEKWLQYVIEILVGGGARQIVKPIAKIKDENAADNVGLNQRSVNLQPDPESGDGSGLRGQNRPGTLDGR